MADPDRARLRDEVHPDEAEKVDLSPSCRPDKTSEALQNDALAAYARSLVPTRVVERAPDAVLAALVRLYRGCALWEALAGLEYSPDLGHYTFGLNEMRYVVRRDGRVHA